MGEVEIRLSDIATGRNTSPFQSTESGSPVAVVSSDFSATISQEVKKCKGGKKQGEKSKKQTNPAIDLYTPFFVHYQQWYMSYYGEELKTPRFNRQDLNLETLWNSVKARGGSQATTMNKKWAEIGRQFNPPKSMTNVSYHIKRLFEKYLLAYEKSVSPHTAMDWRRPPGANKPPLSAKKAQVDLNLECEPASNLGERAQTQSKEETANPFEFWRGDEQLVGSVIRLWTNRTDYQVVKVVSYDAKTKAHTIRFSNDVLNAVFLSQHTWSVCPEDGQSDVKKQEEGDDLDLQFLTPVDTTPALPQPTLNLLQPTSYDLSSVFHHNKHSALHTLAESEEEEDDISSILNRSLSLASLQKQQQQHMELTSSSSSSNAMYAPLVSSLQIQLDKANQRIEQLQAQDRARIQEQETMRLQFAVREQQLQLIIDQMTIKLREATESKQLAEGAATELRKCFEMLVNGTCNTNISNAGSVLGAGFSSPPFTARNPFSHITSSQL